MRVSRSTHFFTFDHTRFRWQSLILFSLGLMRAAAIIFLLVSSVAFARTDRELLENASWTYFGIGYIVADYYVTHRAWPTTRQQLEAHSDRLAAKELPAKDRDMRPLWARFTRIELKPVGRDLLVRTRFRADEGEFSYDALYHPGRTVDAIMQTITPK